MLLSMVEQHEQNGSAYTASLIDIACQLMHRNDCIDSIMLVAVLP